MGERGGAGPIVVGYGGAVARERVVAVANARSAPIERLVKEAGEAGRLIDLSFGRRVRALIFMDSGHVVKVALSPETIIARWRGEEG
jgi:extracellular matrix regulatory protein A